MRVYLLAMLSLIASQVIGQSQSYSLVIEAFDWGPAVTKIVLPNADLTPAAADYQVSVHRQHAGAELDESGALQLLGTYAATAEGERSEDGEYLALILAISPQQSLTNPFVYTSSRNQWVDYQFTITHTPSKAVFREESERYFPDLMGVELDQRFESRKADVKLSFADYQPDYDAATKRPLLIWLHGGGEGGTDTRVPLIANRAVAYAQSPIQDIMDGAYVLWPQTPTFWMQSESGKMTWGDKQSRYTNSLLALIDDYVAKHPGVDTDRIYVGGCSNGGFMTLKLLLARPDFFAAAFPSALGYKSEFLSDEEIKTLAGIPTWYVHSKDDTTTPFATTAGPVVERLQQVGGKVQYSFYEHITDLTGAFGGDDFYYPGHFSWVPCHANHCRTEIGGKSTTIMAWLAAQHR